MNVEDIILLCYDTISLFLRFVELCVTKGDCYMEKTRTIPQQTYCPSCGAPAVSEVCAYCGTATGLNTAEAKMEYPVLECKEAILSFWTVWFPMIFVAAFGIAGIGVIISSTIASGESSLLMMGVSFLLIGIVALFLVLRTITRYIKVKMNGKIIQATVYGYMDDELLINNQPAQIVKLLVQTSKGPRFILYQLGNTLRPYRINDNIDIMVYKNYFMICKNKDVVSTIY